MGRVRVYAWEVDRDQVALSAEIIDGKHTGRNLKIYIPHSQKKDIHRWRCYFIVIEQVYKHHILASHFEEFPV